jgi:formamidopyrimidine-DNA glycosylase
MTPHDPQQLQFTDKQWDDLNRWVKLPDEARALIERRATAKKAYLDHWDMLPPSWLVHFREEGRSCPRCGGMIKTYKAGGRLGYWSPDCQV